MSRIRTEDQHGFHARMARTRGPCLLIITGVHCGACRAMKLALEGNLRHHDGLTVVEVDAGDNPGLSQELEVQHLPALFLYLDGKYHAPISCPPRPDEMVSALDAALASPPMDPP
ncbi:MAG: thioredoxin family protein [Myxococcota bacterium]